MTCLSILADFSNTVDWMVSILLISHSSSPFFKTFARRLQLVSQSPSCCTAFLVLRQGLSTSVSFRFLWFSVWGPIWPQNLLESTYNNITVCKPISIYSFLMNTKNLGNNYDCNQTFIKWIRFWYKYPMKSWYAMIIIKFVRIMDLS